MLYLSEFTITWYPKYFFPYSFYKIRIFLYSCFNFFNFELIVSKNCFKFLVAFELAEPKKRFILYIITLLIVRYKRVQTKVPLECHLKTNYLQM